jgi:hypothetical protein
VLHRGVARLTLQVVISGRLRESRGSIYARRLSAATCAISSRTRQPARTRCILAAARARVERWRQHRRQRLKTKLCQHLVLFSSGYFRPGFTRTRIPLSFLLAFLLNLDWDIPSTRLLSWYYRFAINGTYNANGSGVSLPHTQ